jgi:hypothetical protein
VPAPKNPAEIKEWKRKLGEVGKRPNRGHFKKGIKPWNKGKTRYSDLISQYWKEGRYPILKGKKNNNYRHGKYCTEPYSYIRDEKPAKCEICGCTKNIIIHHKDKNRMNASRRNLQILCQGCHMVLHIFGEKKVGTRRKG